MPHQRTRPLAMIYAFKTSRVFCGLLLGFFLAYCVQPFPLHRLSSREISGNPVVADAPVSSEIWLTNADRKVITEGNHQDHRNLQKMVHDPFLASESSDIEMSLKAWEKDARSTFQRSWEKEKRDNAWQGNLLPQQARLYLQLVRNPILNISTVCETGFFKGMSTHLWLFSKPQIVVHTFDISLDKNYLDDLKDRFREPERLFTHIGDSNLTIPSLDSAIVCDFISVDGSHDGWQPFYDFLHFSKHMRCDVQSSPTYVVFDDTFDLPLGVKDNDPSTVPVDNNPASQGWYNWCTRSYWSAVHRGLIHHISCTLFSEKDGPYPKGFCIGTVSAAKCDRP
jgi:hypothetical protein